MPAAGESRPFVPLALPMTLVLIIDRMTQKKQWHKMEYFWRHTSASPTPEDREATAISRNPLEFTTSICGPASMTESRAHADMRA